MAFTLKQAEKCADDFIAANVTCGGCKWYHQCGVGHRDGKALAELLREVDPTGSNIVLVPLAPIGGGNVRAGY